jgi:hypothetical protein
MVASLLTSIAQKTADAIYDGRDSSAEVFRVSVGGDMRSAVYVNDHLDLTRTLLLGKDHLRSSGAGLVFRQTGDQGFGPIEDALRNFTVPFSDADSHPARPFDVSATVP